MLVFGSAVLKNRNMTKCVISLAIQWWTIAGWGPSWQRKVTNSYPKTQQSQHLQPRFCAETPGICGFIPLNDKNFYTLLTILELQYMHVLSICIYIPSLLGNLQLKKLRLFQDGYLAHNSACSDSVLTWKLQNNAKQVRLCQVHLFCSQKL